MLKPDAVETALRRQPADEAFVDADTKRLARRNGTLRITTDDTPAGARARRMIGERNVRSSFFSDSLFAEPAWDMLLDLYCAHLAQQRACVTSVCAASSVPLSTAIRWLKALEGHGLVCRLQDPLDSRRFFVSLSPQGLEKMNRYLEAVSPGA
jgi:DNA-binding MarR family transcriptional regulator